MLEIDVRVTIREQLDYMVPNTQLWGDMMQTLFYYDLKMKQELTKPRSRSLFRFLTRSEIKETEKQRDFRIVEEEFRAIAPRNESFKKLLKDTKELKSDKIEAVKAYKILAKLYTNDAVYKPINESMKIAKYDKIQ